VCPRRFHKIGHFARTFGIDNATDARLEETAAVGDYGDGMPAQTAIGAKHFGREFRLKFQKIVAVEDARKDILHAVRKAMIGGHHGINPIRRLRGFSGLRSGRRRRQLPKTRANHIEAILVILRHIMRHTAGAIVQMRAAQRFLIDGLPRCALYQIRTAEPHKAGFLHHDDHIAERREIRAAGNTRTHHSRHLRHPQLAPHQRIVVENPAAAVLAGKDAVLIRQIDARGIDQINDRHTVAHGDFLGAQNLGNRLGPPRAGFHRGIVGHNHGGTAFDGSDACHDSRGRRLAVVLVISHEESDFKETSLRIDQTGDPFARGHFTRAVLLLDFLNAAALAEFIFERAQAFDEVPHVGRARDVLGLARWG